MRSFPDDRAGSAPRQRPQPLDRVIDLGADREAEVVPALALLVSTAAREVPGAEAAGLSAPLGRGVRTLAASAPLVSRLDALQDALGEGPCWPDPPHANPVQLVDDLASTQLWPRFSAAAVSLGVRSLLALQLSSSRPELGVLTVCARRPGALTGSSGYVAELFAATAAARLHAPAAPVGELRDALAGRDVLGQARGILMERLGIGPEAALNLLFTVAHRTSRHLTTVAAELVATGEIDLDAPPQPPRPPRRYG